MNSLGVLHFVCLLSLNETVDYCKAARDSTYKISKQRTFIRRARQMLNRNDLNLCDKKEIKCNNVYY